LSLIAKKLALTEKLTQYSQEAKMSEKINATVEIEVPLAAFSGLLHSMVSTMAISILTSKQFPRPTVYTALKIKQTLLLYKFGRKYKLGRFFGSPGRKLNISSVES